MCVGHLLCARCGGFKNLKLLHLKSGFPGGSVGKESVCSAGDAGDMGSVPGSGRPPGGGKWLPTLAFLSAESHGQRSVQSRTRLKRLNTHAHVKSVPSWTSKGHTALKQNGHIDDDCARVWMAMMGGPTGWVFSVEGEGTAASERPGSRHLSLE